MQALHKKVLRDLITRRSAGPWRLTTVQWNKRLHPLVRTHQIGHRSYPRWDPLLPKAV